HYAIDGRPPVPAVARIIAYPYVPLASRLAGSYSEEFLAAIDRALAVKAEHRPQSVAEMRTLLGLDDGSATVALPPAPGVEVPAPAAATLAVPPNAASSSLPPSSSPRMPPAPSPSP